MGEDVLSKIMNVLSENNAQFEHLTHEHVHTSHDAAKIRGNSIEQAAKAIVLKVRNRKKEDYFIQCILPGNRKIDLKRLKALLDLKGASLASPEEVLQITGCTIGSVPPFGDLFGMNIYVDESLFEQDEIVFSSGTHNDSIRMKSSDYKKILSPEVMSFTL